MGSKYVITGVLRNGKRFDPIYTNKPQHYNIWMGTLWELQPNGKRKKLGDLIEGGFIGCPDPPGTDS